MNLDEMKRLRVSLNTWYHNETRRTVLLMLLDDLIERKMLAKSWVPPSLRVQHGASSVKGNDAGTYTVGVDKTNQGGGCHSAAEGSHGTHGRDQAEVRAPQTEVRSGCGHDRQVAANLRGGGAEVGRADSCGTREVGDAHASGDGVVLGERGHRAGVGTGGTVHDVHHSGVTNQGGGGDAAGTSPTQVRTDSAAAASFEERVNSVIESAAGDWHWLAARYLRAGDEVKALNARGVEMAALVSMKDDALAAKDAEIARLTKERDEARRDASARGNFIAVALDDRDALKAALDEEVKATIQSCADDAEAAAPKEGYGRTVALCIASRLRSRADAFDALRSASRAKEGGKC